MNHGRTPELVPILSRGKHRNPRRGACFMEFASYLAGEPWSDHPQCTHPLLAAMAREVNDLIDDANRRDIAPLVPRVIGLTSSDPVIDARLARDAALAALPIASMRRQRVAAVGLLRCEQVLNKLEGRPASHVSPDVEDALDDVPDARDWARDFCGAGFGKLDKFPSRNAPAILHSAVVGIAEAAVGDAQQRLVDLLRRSIDNCEEWMAHDRRTVADEPPHEVSPLPTPKRRRSLSRR